MEAEDLSKADERRFEPEENLNVKQHVNRKGKRGQRLDDQQVQDTMAARSRPRNGAVKDDPTDTHEELSLWEQIKRDLEKCSVIQKRSREVSKLIVETEASMGKCMSHHVTSKPLRHIDVVSDCFTNMSGTSNIFIFRHKTAE